MDQTTDKFTVAYASGLQPIRHNFKEEKVHITINPNLPLEQITNKIKS